MDRTKELDALIASGLGHVPGAELKPMEIESAEIDELIATAKTLNGFEPCITSEDDPTGPGRKLWCWHLPKGVREFHGIVKMIPIGQSRAEYVRALQGRYRLTIRPDQVKCIFENQELRLPPAPPPVAIKQPVISPKADGPSFNKIIIIDPDPGLPPDAVSVTRAHALNDLWEASAPLYPPKSEDVNHVLSSPPNAMHGLQIAELVPLLAVIPEKKYVKVQAPDGINAMSFKSNLRTRLYSKHPESDWSLLSIFPSDPGYVEGEGKRVFMVERRAKAVSKQSLPTDAVTSTQLTEERIETRRTETTVTMPAPAECKPVAAPTPLVESATIAPTVEQSSTVATTPRPESYLPEHGKAALEILDLHEKIANIEDYDEHVGDHDRLCDRIWEVQDGVRDYRIAKRTTDKILKPWLEENFEDLDCFEEILWASCWKDLWERVHGAMLNLISQAEAKESRAIARERRDIKSEAVRNKQEQEFHRLALKFFSEEDNLTEEEWKRINDKELPTLARKIMGVEEP